MALNKLYSRINWENYPSEKTPLNESNMNKMDAALNDLDNRVISQDATKANKTSLNNLISDWTMDENTGIITITRFDGSNIMFDLNIEKIPVDFRLSDDGIITMTTDDGTSFSANIGAMIPVLTFNDSDTIAVFVTGTGVNKTYSFSIKNGSVTDDMLQPNYLADIQTAAGQAATSASEAVQSSTSAAQSASVALSSKESAESSANSAADSAGAAMESKMSAEASATSAVSSANSAQDSAEYATESATSASHSATSALSSKEAAENSEANARQYSSLAEQNASTATDKATLAKSYAVGGTGTREGEDTDNAMYYMNQAKAQTGGIPSKLSQLENDAGFITAAVDNLINYYKSSQLYTKDEVDSKLSAIPKFAIVAVESLPTENISDTTIYLLKEQESGTNKCSEWVYINNAWEKIGDIDIDLSAYLKKTGDGSNLTEAFLIASSLENIATGENHSTIFGKIAKAIATLISHVSTVATTTVFGHVKVDEAMSSSSTNPVQNKVINSALGNKLATYGDASNTTVAFTEATSMAELATGEKMSTLFSKLKLTVKNVISILTLLGSTDISSIGDGTITGGLNSVSRVVSKNSNGLAPMLPNEDTTTKYLRQDGTWAEPKGSGGSSIASEVTYDNSTSGLDATNVQEAIDEVNSNLTTVKNAVTTGYEQINTGTFKKGNIQYINCNIQFPIVDNSAGTYFTIGYAPENLVFQHTFCGVISYGNKIIPALFRITFEKNIQIFLSTEIINLGSVLVTAYLNTDYMIAE